jgi:predicted esterase
VRRTLAVAVATATLTLAIPASVMTPASAAAPKPLGHTCVATSGVRFCTGAKTPSWDGTPLDVDVTLPPTGTGPWPTIVLLHGLGGDKTGLEPNVPQTSTVAPRILPLTENYNNLYYAKRGYAVVAASARGFGQSCGGGGTPAAWLQTGACANGFIRLADQRYEARDTQTILGLLADQGITQPTKIGVTGFSYGGGEAAQLGSLRNKIRLPDGTFRAWRSPQGKPMAIAAAYAQWMWTDLISAVMPNGRFLDFRPATGNASLSPLGVMSQSYTQALYGLAATTGYVAKPLVPATSAWDLNTAVAKLDLGEPYGADVRAIAQEFRRFHGSMDIPGPPAPLLLENGWSDDFFPITESLRKYNSVRADFPRAYVAMLLGDVGHSRDANRHRASLAFNNAASAFFDAKLKGIAGGPANGSVLTYTTTCPALGATAIQDGGPYRARSWAAIHPDQVLVRGAGAQTINSTGGDPTVGLKFDPIPSTNPLGTGDPCKSIPTTRARGTAVYQRAINGRFTLLGRPTVRATIATTGSGGQIAARLWDVAPSGSQRLITRGVYRLTNNQTGALTFQLNGNGYTFRSGHIVKLELAPSDAPTYRASNGLFSVKVSNLTMTLPILAR